MPRYVCAECLGDPALKEIVEANAAENECDFCGASSNQPIAADVRQVSSYISECLEQEYDNAANWLSYVSSEGGWQGTWWDTPELLDHIGLDLPNDDGDLFDAIIHEMEDWAWCEKNPYGLNYEDSGIYSWRNFAHIVKHERRFFFSQHPAESGDVLSPSQTLQTIFDHAEKVGLFVTLPAGTRIFRARFQATGETHDTAKALGPPPVENATQSNRMSPPGIVMLYASDSQDTALRETAAPPGNYAVGEFQTRRDATILDLSQLPGIPSLFEPIPDSLEYRPREVLTFLDHVASEISRPIARDDRVHVNYVPTQVVTEYVRSRLTLGEKPVDGIRFVSSVHAGHASYVLFATQENLVGGADDLKYGNEDRWIELVDREVVPLQEQQIAEWRHQNPTVDFEDSP